MSSNIIQAVKGTRDFYPIDFAFQNWISQKMQKAAELFGYQQWDGPIIEPFELYAAKSGDELVNEQAFVMDDRGGRKIVLRPELTPSLARMVAQKQQVLGKPLRWYAIGPMWRYEQPQRGRSREFWQWNVDCLGVDSPLADAEIIAVAITFLKSLDLTEKDFIVKINDRTWFEQKMTEMDIAPKDFPKVLRAVDRIDKMDAKKWQTYVLDLGITKDQYDQLYKLLTEPATLRSVDEDSSLAKVINNLVDYGLEKYISLDLKVVRGLDYYTGTVFEIRDRDGVLRAIGGGGRYGNLVEQVGGTALSGVGFALGDIPLKELLVEADKLPEDIGSRPEVLVTVFDEASVDESLATAQRLRDALIPTEVYIPSGAKTDLDKQLKYADTKNIPYVVIIGPQEIEKNQLTVKDLRNRSQDTMSTDELIKKLKD